MCNFQTLSDGAGCLVAPTLPCTVIAVSLENDDPGHWRMVPSTQSSHPAPLIDVVLMIIIARAEYCPENRYLIDIWCFLEDYLRKVQICESEKFYPLIKVIEGQFSARIPFNAQLLVLSLWDIKYVLKMHLLKIYLSNTPPNVVI